MKDILNKSMIIKIYIRNIIKSGKKNFFIMLWLCNLNIWSSFNIIFYKSFLDNLQISTFFIKYNYYYYYYNLSFKLVITLLFIYYQANPT